MATATIDFSLDLGVTNSRIAVARNGAAQVVLTGEGLESTPTAVWCDERERLIVGSQIRDRLVDDAANVAERFMAQLGTGEVFRFARQNRPAEPEDLAAEVIGSLRADARRRTGRDVSAAVLTAPAGFAAAQRDALIAAARKAGVAVSPLLQEPVAAALAYGGPAADAQWLIYDFGGAAFEAALVVLHDGVVQVASHAGDSRLGGELVDWAIVDKLLIPAVAAQFAVTSFRRDNPKWRIAVAKLKMAAEEARIRLDHESSAQIMVPFLCRDDSGAPVRFRHTLTRSELETLLEPVVRRSLKVCERLLVKRDLGFDDLERVVVSGGATRDPYFSRLLTEEGGGLGRRVASSVDPFTVVVQGAALYAGGEPVERAAPPVFVGGQEVAPEPEAEVVEETPVAEPEVTEEEIEEPVEVEEVAAEVPAFAEEEAEEPAEEEAVEPAAEAEEAPVAEEAPEEAAAPEAPEVAEPLMAEPVWPSTADIAEPAAAEEEVAQPVAAEEEVEEPVAAEEEVAEPVAAEEEVEEPAEEEAVEPAAEAEEVPVAEEATEEAAAPEAPEVAEPLMAEPVWPSAADIAEPAEVPPDALGTWIGIPWQRETEERVPTGALPIPDEHAAAEEWRRVSQEAEAAEAAARAEEAAPELEGVPESALEVEKTAPVEAEEEAEEPAEPAALEPAAEEATEEAAAPEAPEVAEPLIVEPVWPSAAEEVPASQLNRELTRYASEQQVFRIDHYLGKETVQNILMFRFSNAIFERLWHRESIDHLQITVSEKLGVGQRGGYYEEAGALRDMVQNHLLQVLSLVAMEPPVSLEAEAIRDEKVKLLKSIRTMSPEDVARQVVRGQYFAGTVDGESRPGYRQEPKVKPDSNVETYVALELFIDNWRWSGVPFFLRTGKNLPLSTSEVRIQFRPTPHVLFAAQCGQKLDPNALTLRLQPNEGISLRFNGKVPGTSVAVRPVRMHFSYDAEFGAYTPEAYERLLLEAMAGDATLFIRRDEVETAWQIADGIRLAWQGKSLSNREFYAAGTWGPVAADDLLAQSGHAWREPLVIK